MNGKPIDASDRMDTGIENNSMKSIVNSNEVGCSTCKSYKRSLKNLLQSGTDCISVALTEQKDDLHFVRAIVWLKHAVASMKKISFADFQSAFSYRENVYQNSFESSERRIVHDLRRDSYETQSISQDSVNTIEELFTHHKPMNNESIEIIDEILGIEESPVIERHSTLDKVLTLVDITESPQRYEDKNLLEDHMILKTNSFTHLRNSDIFDESGTSTHFNSPPELQHDNTDCIVSDFGPVTELTRGNAFQSLGSFSSFHPFGNSANSFTRNSRVHCRENNSGCTNNIDKTIVNNSSLLCMEEDDSGYSTLQLVPQSFKRKFEESQGNKARWKSLKMDSELFKTELETWDSDSNVEQCQMISRNVSDLQSQNYTCDRSENSINRFTSELFAQSGNTDCSVLAAKNSLESLCSNLNESFRMSKLSRTSKTVISVNNDDDVEFQENCDNESDCQMIGNFVTSDRTSICSKGSFQLSGELHFSALSKTSTNFSQTFRKSEKHESFSLLTTDNIKKSNGEHNNFCAKQNNLKTQDDDVEFQENSDNESDCQMIDNFITPEITSICSKGSFQLTGELHFSPLNRIWTNLSPTFHKTEKLENNGEQNDVCARQDTEINIELFTPIDNRKAETSEIDETLFSDYLNFILDSSNVDKLASNFINVILGYFEDGRITKTYMKGRRWENTLEKEAVQTVLCFCCVFEAETKSSAITRSIVEMIERSLDRAVENYQLCDMTERIQHVSIILEFVCFKDVCITIINYLILKLESNTKDVITCASKEQLTPHESLSKLQVVMRALKICLKKYRLVRFDNEESTNETLITDSWRDKRQPRSNSITKSNVEGLEERWMNVLEELPVILVDDFFYLALESRALKTLLLPK